MQNRIDLTFLKNSFQQIYVSNIANHELCIFGHRPIETGGQIVHDDDVFTSVQQMPHHVRPDITGSTRHEN